MDKRTSQSRNNVIRRIDPLTFPFQTDDPFLFCAHHLDQYPEGNVQMGPSHTLQGRQLGMDFSRKDGWSMYHGEVVPGFPRHPHRGFETITVAQQGLIDHSDSLGATARFGEGDAQWMTAGQGIVHSEMFPLVQETRPNPTELFQVWLNLPRASKLVEPYFTMLWREAIPRHTLFDAAGKRTRVVTVAGALSGDAAPAPPPHSWAARAESHVAIWTLTLEPGARWTLPEVEPLVGRSLYFYRGASVTIGGQEITSENRIILQDETSVELQAGEEEVHLLLLQGRAIGEPVAHHGPFVMNTRAELAQAFADYQRTGFGEWPWKTSDPVHPREQGRFARHADGRVEDRPT